MCRRGLKTDLGLEAMQTWLWVCLGLGVIVLGMMLLHQWRERRSKWARSLMEEIATAVVVVWPGSIAYTAWNRLKNRGQPSDETIYAEDPTSDARRWKVLPAHLKKQVTPESVVALEKVADPLGAAPNVPFGFLLVRWVDFMRHWKDGDELWTFEVPPANFDYARRGYAIVRRGLPVAGFVTDVVEV